jgi:hypothetical protein
MVVAPDSGLPSGTVVADVDPQFVDLPAGDLHLSATSPAIDVCAGNGGGPVSDLDIDLRGHDLPAVPDRLPGSFFDAGADEIGPPGPLFADGFESGDVSEWSGASGSA